MLHLFDVHPGIKVLQNDKPRAATESEVLAYLDWIRQRHGLPDMRGPRQLHWRQPRDWRKGQCYCIGVTLGDKRGGEYETGAYSIVMPGHDAYRHQSVTMETLDDTGEVVASQTLPVEPKKGGVIWSRDDVRKAAGPVAKIKVKPARIAPPAPMPEISAPEAVQHDSAAGAAPTHAQPVEALDGRENAPPAVSCEHESQPVDVFSELLARVEALEASVATLSGKSSPGDIGGIEPMPLPSGDPRATGAARARLAMIAQPSKRSAAHERAIRRAWTERRDKRLQRAIAEDHMRMREQVQAALQNNLALAEAERLRVADLARDARAKRRRAVTMARERISRLRTVANNHRQHVAALSADLAKIKRDMADSSQPERASDLARLIRERDEARTALAASHARCQRQDAAIEALAGELEKLASRVAIAEAALRRAA